MPESLGGLGMGELTVVAMVVLLILGSRRLPPRTPPSAAAVVTLREDPRPQPVEPTQ